MSRHQDGEWLLGLDLAFFSHGSDIAGPISDLTTRGFYLGPSVKWTFGDTQRFSLDAGAGYYEFDIAEVESTFYTFTEVEYWSERTGGGYLGLTWDIASPSRRNNGVTLSLRSHFVDLGTVANASGLGGFPLGTDAGELSGPIYQFQVGYRWR